MNLKDFIKESIIQISSGIIDANNELKFTGTVINPDYIKVYPENSKAYGRVEFNDKDLYPLVHLIEFDVAVEVTSENQKDGGIKLSVASIGIRDSAKSLTNNSSISRIQFKIPMTFPSKNYFEKV